MYYHQIGRKLISVQFLKKGDVTKLATIGLSPLLLYVQKIIDHIIFHGIMIHLNANNILIENQHRFRPSHSYVIQLITLTEDVLYALDHQKQADIVLLDFAKAFDIVPHRRLLKKLHYYGIRNNIFKWIKTWLTNHTQCVLLNGDSSKSISISSGVPQETGTWSSYVFANILMTLQGILYCLCDFLLVTVYYIE